MSASLATDPLWSRARTSFSRALAVCGEPAAIAAISCLTRKLRAHIVRWIAPLENIVRKLLLVEAAQLLGPRTSSSARAPQGALVPKPCAQTPAIDRAAPHTWSATFALAPPADPHLVPEHQAPRIRSLAPDPPFVAVSTAHERRPAMHHPFDAAYRLARRVEALRRVLADPSPHARRLARLLQGLRRRFPGVVMRYAMSSAHAVGWDPDDPKLAISATSAAITAEPAFWRDTS
jgi:hypothetical protein